MRFVAGRATQSVSGLMQMCFLELISLLAVAADAQRLAVSLRKHHLAIRRRLMARVACVHRKWRMSESLHKLGRARLMRIVALNAVCVCERLSLVRLDQRRILRIVTVKAQRR